MKKSLFVCGVILVKLVGSAGAAVVVDENWAVGAAIPEGSPVGMTASQTFTGLSSSPITDVSVNLDISGGYNAGLYGYLVLQDANGSTATEILLNSVGTTPSNPFGSSGSGFNVTLSDGGTANGSIHGATGIPTGIWQPDSANTLDATFGGLTANGTWTLFLADLSTGGGTSTLVSWGLDINTVSVPEVANTGMISGLGGLMLVAGGAFRRARAKNNSK